ncbi:MAG: LamG domain-containing protein, partial [Candidatus Aenigmatarchaeota archaeon]
DTSGNGNIGTLTNMNTTGNTTSGWTSGKFGKGLQFDGANDYVALPETISDLTLTNNKTISFWAKLAANGVDVYNSQAVIRLKSGVYIHYRTTTNQINFRFDNAGARISYYVLGTNEFGWHFISGVFTSDGANSTLALYVDGLLLNTNTFAAVPTAYGENSIGKISTTSFNGTIDEVRIWSKAFSPDETVSMKRII